MVYSVIHVLTGMSIELQPCLGMSWYDSNVARVCTNKARIYSIKQGLSRFEHNLQNDFHTIVVWFPQWGGGGGGGGYSDIFTHT